MISCAICVIDTSVEIQYKLNNLYAYATVCVCDLGGVIFA